ncbi:MAG: helix-turn-helix domain-containing protein [Anaeromyxobacteraceae bacterium]
MASHPVTQGSFTWDGPAREAGPRPVRLPRPPAGPRWLTAEEATVHLGLPSRKALYAAVERGQVPAHRLGRRRLRFRLDELDSLLGRLPESTGVR